MSDHRTLVRATLRGTFWNYASFAGGKGLAFISTIILARLLVPADFGLLALGLVITGYLDVLVDFGVGAALVYRQEDPERTANVAFILSVATGLTLTILAFLGAPLVASFFHEPRVAPIIRVLALSFIISALSNIHSSRLSKSLDFGRRFIPEMAKAVVKGGASIILALAGWGVWSLVWGQIAGLVVMSGLYWWANGWRPAWSFDLGIARSLIGYGLQIVVIGLLGMVINNVDYLIIGRRLTTTDLGFYTIGYRVPELIIMNMCVVVSRVIFPAYSRLQGEPDALQRGYLTTLGYVSLFTIPMGIGMAFVAPEFVELFYTERWMPAIPVMQMLAIYALIYSLGFNTGDIFKATGRPGVLTRLAVINLLVAIPVLWLAADHGINAVAGCQIALTSLATSINVVVAVRMLKVRIGAIIGALRPAALGALVMLIALGGMRPALPQIGAAPRLLILVLVGGVAYGLTLWIVGREMLTQAMRLARPTSPKPAAPPAM